MSNFNEKTSERAESAVRNHVIWSMGAGFIPIPVADFASGSCCTTRHGKKAVQYFKLILRNRG